MSQSCLAEEEKIAPRNGAKLGEYEAHAYGNRMSVPEGKFGVIAGDDTRAGKGLRRA